MTVKERIEEIRHLRAQITEIEQSLLDEISRNASIVEAIGTGLVKPTFRVPVGFMKYCQDRFK